MTAWLWALALIFIIGPLCAITAYIVWTAAKPILDAGHHLPWWVRAVVYFWLPVGALFDILINATYAWLSFEERPKELYLTDRLQRYRTYPDDDWRKLRAIRGWRWLNYFSANHW